MSHTILRLPHTLLYQLQEMGMMVLMLLLSVDRSGGRAVHGWAEEGRKESEGRERERLRELVFPFLETSGRVEVFCLIFFFFF